jgi:hypothetical protein
MSFYIFMYLLKLTLQFHKMDYNQYVKTSTAMNNGANFHYIYGIVIILVLVSNDTFLCKWMVF